jgi:hypothetical protein
MRIAIVTLMAMFALTGCGSLMERYQSKVTEMKTEGVSKFGVNHGYDTSLLVGAKSVWGGKTCLELFANYVDYTSENTFISLQRGSVAQATSNALRSCESKGYGVCVPILVNDKCVLEGQTPIRPSVHSSQAPETISSPLGLDISTAKEKCVDLGFKAGTEEFGKCVLKILK